jgi:hypothetical protein
MSLSIPEARIMIDDKDFYCDRRCYTGGTVVLLFLSCSLLLFYSLFLDKLVVRDFRLSTIPS